VPTASEWEWAARGRGEGRWFPWGFESPKCERAVMALEAVDGCGAGRTAPVGSRPRGKSRDGVLDLAGNVAEWTSTAKVGKYLVTRGGSWNQSIPSAFRAGDRTGAQESTRGGIETGFRCVVDVALARRGAQPR
jgi:formylglycine-generating enzyme required for sulfatase activity